MKAATSDSRTMSYSQELADFLAGLTYGDLPGDTIHAAKRSLLDTLGAGIHGSDAEEARLIARTALAINGSGPARVWGTNLRTGIGTAALVNGSAAHAREMDDFGGCGHSGAVVIPAALASASTDHTITGRDLVVAIVAGYDMAARVTLSVGGYGPHNELGWHSTATCGAFGAAVAAGTMQGLDSGQLTSAIGLAGTYGGGLWAFIADGAMSKRLHPGKASESGVVAASLAQNGFTGPKEIFEAEWGGFWHTYAPNDFNPDALIDQLGTRYLIHTSGFKPYAACRGVHSSLDVVFRYQADRGLTAENVDRIVITMHPRRTQMVGGKHIETVLDAQMSVAYGVAAVLTWGSASVVQYQEDKIQDPRIVSLMDRIEIVSDPTLPPDQQPGVEFHLTTGESFGDSVAFALGAPENPMSDDALIEKFRTLTSATYDDARIDEIVETIWNIEQAESLESLDLLLTPSDKVT